MTAKAYSCNHAEWVRVLNNHDNGVFFHTQCQCPDIFIDNCCRAVESQQGSTKCCPEREIRRWSLEYGHLVCHLELSYQTQFHNERWPVSVNQSLCLLVSWIYHFQIPTIWQKYLAFWKHWTRDLCFGLDSVVFSLNDCHQCKRKEILCNHKLTWICRLFLNYCYESSLIFFPRWNKYRLNLLCVWCIGGKRQTSFVVSLYCQANCTRWRTIFVTCFCVFWTEISVQSPVFLTPLRVIVQVPMRCNFCNIFLRVLDWNFSPKLSISESRV